MADGLKQEGRVLGITTPLGPDKLAITAFSMTESISGLFSLNADLVSEDQDITADKLVGQKATVRVTLPNETRTQFFNGFVQRFSQGEASGKQSERVRHYSVELVPWLWFLTQRSNLRVFEKMTVPDILKKVLDVGDVKDELQGSFPVRDYCVQYRETDFNFVSRLMEEEGIFYFFRHEDGNHTLVLGNSPGVHQPAEEFEKYDYVPDMEEAGGGGVVSWSKSQELRSGKVHLRDYQFQIPDKKNETTAPAAEKLGGNDKLEIYDYPGEYAQWFNDPDKRMDKVPSEGQRVGKIRMQEIDAAVTEHQGSVNLCGMSSGCKFDLNAKTGGRAGAYVLTGVRHSATQSPMYFSNEAAGNTYSSSFTCIPLAVPFRPQRMTPKPIVQGMQTAVVVGTPGEEIHTDKYGRVRVRFPWDREGKNDDKATCWLRVASAMAGKNWGMIHIPRVGHEVLVAFMEGDPDQPIVVGSLYNPDNMPPYELDKNKTQSGIKTRSSKGGGDDHFNEICFEDKKGQEFIYVRAEKDMVKAVESDETHWVGHDRWAEIDHDDTLKVGHDQTIEIGNNRTETVEKDETISIKGNRTETVEKDETISIKGNRIEEVEKIDKVKIKGLKYVIVEGPTFEKTEGFHRIESKTAIELKVGGSSIKITPAGITIKGTMIKIKAQAKTEIKGAITNVIGDGLLKAKGAIAMIN